MTKSTWLLLLPIIFISSAVSAANIDVLVVFSDDSGLSAGEKAGVALRYQRLLSDVYDNQLSGNQTIKVWATIAPEMSYDAYNKSLSQAAQWMIDQNALLASPLRIARDSIGNQGADLVLMVVPSTTDSRPPGDDCGLAPEASRVVSTNRSESHAFAAVVLEENNAGCLERFVVPHEIGHLLYAEHETDENGSESLPDYRNHAMQSYISSSVSLMWHKIVATSTNDLSGSRPDMTSARANNVAFMSSESFDVVSQYRAVPGSTSVSVLFLGCHQPLCALWSFQFEASNAEQYRIQSAPYAFGPWSTWKVTSGNSYFPHLGQNPRYFRVRGENSVGVGGWTIVFTTGECGDRGGGGGGPLD